MPKSDTATMIELAACGNEFMKIVQDFQQREDEDPTFDTDTELHFLYANLAYLCNKTKLNLSKL